ncbi:MAG: WD40 repeat domain-containing protein, partial [Chthoniobacteraceae bacterium]|nr:WD40 repeat domain-containing protein [Chthoniobacteraceae bacterium]
ERMRSEGRKANSPYVRRQAVGHFIIAEQWDEAVAALSDLEFVEARAKAGELGSMLGDFDEALGKLPEMQKKAKEHQLWQETMRRWSEDLAKYSAGCIRQRIVGGSLPLLPTAPKAITLKTSSEIAVECERIIKSPNRVDTLSALRKFVATQKGALETFSNRAGFVAQHAINDAPAGPVHQQGGAMLNTAVMPRILRHWTASDTYNPLHPCMMVLEGNSWDVTSVAISADASLAVSGSADYTLCVWDLKTGGCIRVLKGHSIVYSVAISVDKSLAVSGHSDNTLHFWDLHSGECIRVLEGHSDTVHSVAISADTSLAVSGSVDKTLRVWDLRTGNCTRVLEGHSDEVFSVAISADTSLAVSGSKDKTLRVWDLKSGKCIRVLEGHSDGVNAVAISADASLVVSGCSDNTLRVWDLKSGNCIRVFDGHSTHVNSLAISADASLAVSGSSDHTLRVWDLKSGKCIHALKVDSLESFALHKTTLVTGSAFGLQVYRLGNFPLGPFITTAFRNSTARPVCCGQLVDVPAAVTERI